MLVLDVHLAVLDVRVWNIHTRTSNTDSSSNINISKENTLLLIHISDTWYKATYIHNEIKFIEHLFPACHEETEVKNLEVYVQHQNVIFLCLDNFVTVLYFLQKKSLIITSALSKAIKTLLVGYCYIFSLKIMAKYA